MRARIRDFVPMQGGGILTLTLQEDFRNAYDELHECDIEVDIEKWSEKRSLSANSYMWVLCDKIARKLNMTKEDVYRKNIREAGGWRDREYTKQDAEFEIKAWEGRGLGWFAEIVDEWRDRCVVRFYYGSSVYPKRRMSKLIDSVVQDAISCEVDVKTPDEIAKMISLMEDEK